MGEITNKVSDKENKTLFYTGKQWDEDAQLYYFNARWYDPETGRFITEDPVRDGLNWYVYCSNNPVNYVDPTGLYRVWGHRNKETDELSYSISTAQMYGKAYPVIDAALDVISNIVPFHQPRIRMEQFLQNYVFHHNIQHMHLGK